MAVMLMRGEDKELRDAGAVWKGGGWYRSCGREGKVVKRLLGFGVFGFVGGGVG